MLFALLRGALCTAALAVASAPALAAPQTALPAGGKYHDCHGYVRHVSSENIRVHCIDGRPADLSFLYIPRYADIRTGKSVQVKDLQPNTPVHVIFTQSLGVRKAYKIYVADPSGRGLYGFKS
ncbi:MAG: hypothetical protein ABR591_11690 [Candidatus Velthaea sp.]